MHCSCVRHTDLPHTSSLFADVLYHPDRTAAFYPHPIRDLNDFRASASAIDISGERRAALVAALRQVNPASPALDRLAQPGTVAVVTGQQVGLFSGPAYTIYKVLHAARLAAQLSEEGIPAVPLFWLATEDHDFAEVNHAWIFDAAHRPVKLEMKRAASAQPVGEVTLAAPPVRELRAAFHSMPFGDEIADIVEETYRGGSTMGRAFGELLRRLLQGFDVPQVDPMQAAFRELAAPAMRNAVETAPELTSAVLARNKELTDAGYHAQVHVEEQTAFFFLLENGKRMQLRRHGREYVLNGRRFTTEELADRAESLSPNAILRPVIQDSVLPTVAYIGGPAEIAYLAQSEAIYRTVLGRMPVAVPRTGFTILDRRTEKLMGRYGIGLTDLFHGEDVLRQRIAAHIIPPTLRRTMEDAHTSVDAALDRLRRELAVFDPTLAAAMTRSGRKIQFQIGKIERKAASEAMRRDERAARDAAYIYGLIYPEKHLQERLYTILPFLATHGPGLIGLIYDSIQLDCPDHRLMVV
jgi:bacillithiol biosynthesis cysteine-adding enzyme BshC